MKRNFDIDNRERKTPYSVPEGFFEKLEDSIWREVSSQPIVIKKKCFLSKTIILRSAASIAAVVTIAILLNINLDKENQFLDIDTAFNNLSIQDQAFMIEIYEDDILLNI